MSAPPQLEVRHATRLEWIIIWLIVAEVCVCARAPFARAGVDALYGCFLPVYDPVLCTIRVFRGGGGEEGPPE